MSKLQFIVWGIQFLTPNSNCHGLGDSVRDQWFGRWEMLTGNRQFRSLTKTLSIDSLMPDTDHRRLSFPKHHLFVNVFIFIPGSRGIRFWLTLTSSESELSRVDTKLCWNILETSILNYGSGYSSNSSPGALREWAQRWALSDVQGRAEIINILGDGF